MLALAIWGLLIMTFAPAAGAFLLLLAIIGATLNSLGNALPTLGAVPSDLSRVAPRRRRMERREMNLFPRVVWLVSEVIRVGFIIIACAAVAVVLALAYVHIWSKL